MLDIIDKPWGRELIWAKTDFYVGKILEIRPGHTLSLQYHEEKTETLLVVSGRAIFEMMGMNFDICADDEDPVHIEPGEPHRIFNPSDTEECRIVEVSTTELDDVVRIKDFYNR
jgi:mannose-6-phosphate isomerase-like protein (cupin superfamily)